MGIETLTIENLLSDTTVGDDVLVDTKTTARILGKPGEPVSTKTIYRERNKPDGLEWVEIAGQGNTRVGALRTLVRSRMRHPNRRRERGGAYARPST